MSFVVKLLIMHKDTMLDILEAAAVGNTASIQRHLKQGTSIETKDEYGRTALMQASNHCEVVEFLLNNGANVNSVDSSGKTALIFSVFAGNLRTTQLLLTRGADAQLRDTSGKLPVTYAWEASNYEMLQVFYDAEPKFDLALAAVFGELETIKEILREGGNIDKKNEFGETALTAAIGRDNIDVTEYLIQAGANVNLIGRYSSPLVSAILKRNVPIVINLISHGANVNDITDYGTPLIAAVTSGVPMIVEVLLENHADINAVDAEGDTAFSLAVYEENSEIVELLERKIKELRNRALIGSQ